MACEELGGASCFVRLQRADRWNLGAGELADGWRLLLPFLHAVFAEEAQAGSIGFQITFSGMHLADRHQRDFGLGAAGAAAGVGDLFPDAGEIFSEWHPRSILWVFRRLWMGARVWPVCVADWVEYFYDVCLVWTSEVQGSGVVEGDPGELGDRLL